MKVIFQYYKYDEISWNLYRGNKGHTCFGCVHIRIPSNCLISPEDDTLTGRCYFGEWQSDTTTIIWEFGGWVHRVIKGVVEESNSTFVIIRLETVDAKQKHFAGRPTNRTEMWTLSEAAISVED